MISRIVRLIRKVMGTDKLLVSMSEVKHFCQQAEIDQQIKPAENVPVENKLSHAEKSLSLENKSSALEKLPLSEEYLPYFPRRPGEKIRIVFLLQSSTLWFNWKSLWEACQQDPNIEATIVLVEKTYIASKLHQLNETKNFLIMNQLPFIMGSMFSLERYRPHIGFVQTPYDDTLPSEYSLKAFRSIGCRLAYIPYGLEIGGGATNLKYQFNMPVHQQAWRIFARSKRHLKMYAKYCSVGCAHVRVTGHPKLDLYRDTSSLKIASHLIEKINQRKTILWCPHFSILKDQWSTFLTYAEPILTYFTNHPELFLIVRPHPFLFSTLRDQLNWTDEKITALKTSINSMQNAYLDEEPDHRISFKLSNALLADAGSFLLEYLSTGKPVAYLENSNGPGLNEDGDVIQHFYVMHNTQDIDQFFMMINDDKDPKKEQRLRAIPEYLHKDEKEVGVIIKEQLLNSIHEYDHPMVAIDPSYLNTKLAEEYWQKATTTYLAASDYYDRQEVALENLLKKIGPVNSTLDVGCGDGRFTKMLSEYSQYTKAIDISSHLIAQAKNNVSSEKIDFEIESITEAQSCHRYTMVSCMGVTSGLIDDEVFLRTLDVLIGSCKPGGYLLMKDTLSLKIQQNVMPNEQGYIAVYRNIENYLRCFLSRGCRLIDQHELFLDLNRGMINKLFLFSVPVTH